MSDPSRNQGPSVLVVDDHRISREYTVAALREIAASVKQAGSAEAALQTALRFLPDVICMDIDLAGASGLELIERIRECWPLDAPHPRVFALSAEQPSPEQLRLAGTAVERFLLKPVGLQQLRAILAPVSPTVAAPGPLQPDPELRRLFRQELRYRLDELDRCISTGNLAAASALLHQLIASSGLCRERDLEPGMRSMLSACREKSGPARLARSYYSMWVKARYYLDSAGSVGSA
jgi:CheY-like chemotaxis protein